MKPSTIEKTKPRLSEVIFSLRKSRSRRDILMLLTSTFPEPSYISEIARKIGASSTEVIGAIRGINGRYAPRRSLLELGLVEKVNSRWSSLCLYRATKLGCEIAKVLLTKGGRTRVGLREQI